MAKLQKATLDPSKISGRCGRLKCCLRYEYDTYEALSRELPSPGSLVLTREGNVTVIAQDILSQQLTVRTEDNRRIMIHGDDVLSVTRPAENSGKTRRGKSKKSKSPTPTTDD
jgi:cell fate regulator YaaT (PSP1 superfamily)